MARQNEHGRLIAAAAKAALVPLGCRRVGQSRCWISDQRCWLIFIEFQPSGWAKGSYLNVTPHWLWLRYGGNDFHPRPADFIAFESAEQFTPLIENMAAIAAQTILDMRKRFQTPNSVYSFFAERLSDNPYSIYRTAVTAGLIDDTNSARHLFERMEAVDGKNYGPWIELLKTDCAKFAAVLGQPNRYRAQIAETVAERRRRFRLLPDSQYLESWFPETQSDDPDVS